MTQGLPTRCPTGLRAFDTRAAADRALGKAQAKRTRRADRAGSRRGLVMEHRPYACELCPRFHLTSLNRQDYYAMRVAA